MTDGPLLTLSQHDSFGLIEEEFNGLLDQSLDPRGPEMLFDLVGELGLPYGVQALDVGCGDGRHTIELARRFGFDVVGVDPVDRHFETAIREFEQQISPETMGSVNFAVGSAERLPVDVGSVDLVWCRDVLCMVQDLDAAYSEFRRVLKPNGRVLVYQMFATHSLEPAESAWLLPTMGCVVESMIPERTEAAILAAGFQIDRIFVLGSEWGEFGQERTGKGARKLLHAGRLIREPERFVQRYGQENYDIALGDCLWHVYRLIGKLSDRVYLLSGA